MKNVLPRVSLLLALGARALDGQPAGSEFRVNSSTTGVQSYPAVAADSTGRFAVAWQGPGDGDATAVFAQRYAADGGPLGPELRVNTWTTGAQAAPAVAALASGDFVVVWHSDLEDGSYTGVYGQRYAAGGAPLGGEFRINTTTTDYQNRPAVASAGDGFVVVWQSYGQDGSGFGIYGQRYDSAGAPLGGEFRVSSYTAYDQSVPRVASDTAGDFTVVWSSPDQDGSDSGVYGQRFSASGAPLGTEFRVNTYTTKAQSAPSISADADGNFVVAWQSKDQDGSLWGVYAQRFASSGAPLGQEFRVNEATADYQSLPSVAANPAGGFVVAWQSYGQDGSGFGIYARRWDAAGSPVGSEFRVNTHTADYQTQAAATSTPTGFAVVWKSDFQDGSLGGIFGQRFTTPGCHSGAHGDVNGDGQVTVTDVFFLINALFAAGPAPVCGADANGDTKVDVVDVFYLINFLFAGGAPPV